MGKLMKKLMKKLPNLITLLRVVLTLILNFYIVYHFGSLLIPLIICLIIFISDFVDGRIARAYGSISRVGAVFDAVADLFYIVLSYIVLYCFNVLPLWFLFIILFKFAEFIITSHFIKCFSGKKTVFVFDFLGRLSAVVFYAIPISSYILFSISNLKYLLVINLILIITTALALISSSYRIKRCVSVIKFLKEEAY